MRTQQRLLGVFLAVMASASIPSAAQAVLDIADRGPHKGSGGSMTRSPVLWVGVLAAIVALGPAPVAAAVLDGCAPMVVANDTTNATNAFGPIAGTALGQVFLAPDA